MPCYGQAALPRAVRLERLLYIGLTLFPRPLQMRIIIIVKIQQQHLIRITIILMNECECKFYTISTCLPTPLQIIYIIAKHLTNECKFYRISTCSIRPIVPANYHNLVFKRSSKSKTPRLEQLIFQLLSIILICVIFVDKLCSFLLTCLRVQFPASNCYYSTIVNRHT